MATVSMVKNLKGLLTVTCKACDHRVIWSVDEAEVRQELTLAHVQKLDVR